MPDYTVSIPADVLVTVTADAADSITEEMVEEALLAAHGKYVTLDPRTDMDVAGFEVLDGGDGAPAGAAPMPDSRALDLMAAWFDENTNDDGQWGSAADFIGFAADLLGRSGRRVV